MGEDKGRYNNDTLEYMKYLKIRWIAVLLVAVGTSFFFGFKSGDNRSFQVLYPTLRSMKWPVCSSAGYVCWPNRRNR